MSLPTNSDSMKNPVTEFSASGTLGDVFIVFCKLCGYHKRTGKHVRLHRYSRFPELDAPIGEFFDLISYIEYVTPSHVVGSDINSIEDCKRLGEPHVSEFWDGDGRGNFTDDPEDVVFEPFPSIELQPEELPSERLKVGIQLFSGKVGGNFKGFSLRWITGLRRWLPESEVDVYLFGVEGVYSRKKVEKLCHENKIVNLVGQLDFVDWLRHIKAMDFFITPEGFSSFFAMSQKVKTLVVYVDYGMIGRIHPEWRKENIFVSAGWRNIGSRISNRLFRAVKGRYPFLCPVKPEIVYSMIHSKFSYINRRELHMYWFKKYLRAYNHESE